MRGRKNAGHQPSMANLRRNNNPSNRGSQKGGQNSKMDPKMNPQLWNNYKKRNHIAIFMDPCLDLCKNCSFDSRKNAQSKGIAFDRSLLSVICEEIIEYMRICFDLLPDLVTFDIVSCALLTNTNKSHFAITDIDKNRLKLCIDLFGRICGAVNVDQTRFVAAIHSVLKEAPTDFYSNKNPFNRPFDLNSVSMPPLFDNSNGDNEMKTDSVNATNDLLTVLQRGQCNTDVFVLLRNQTINTVTQQPLLANEFQINSKTGNTIDFIQLLTDMKQRNVSISKVFIIKISADDNYKTKQWSRLELPPKIELAFKHSPIQFYGCTLSINYLNNGFVNALSNHQFCGVIRATELRGVPFKPSSVMDRNNSAVSATKNTFSIPIIVNCESLKSRNLFTDKSQLRLADNMANISHFMWQKIPSAMTSQRTKIVNWSEWIPLQIHSISAQSINDVSRLLLKFLAKKGFAVLKAIYKPNGTNEKTIFESMHTTHIVRMIGMNLYLITVIHYNDLAMIPDYSQYNLQYLRLPNVANKTLSHCFDQWINDSNIINQLSNVKPPQLSGNNGFNILELDSGAMSGQKAGAGGIRREAFYYLSTNEMNTTIDGLQSNPQTRVNLGTNLTAYDIVMKPSQ